MRSLIFIILMSTGIGSYANDSIIINAANKFYLKWSTYAKNKNVIIVDYSIPMENDRLYIVDVSLQKIIYRTKVCHGIGSGMASIPTKFSNMEGSKMSSEGVMITGETYYGNFGYSMKIDGLENINSNVRSRNIVFHSNLKLSTEWSWGCFSVPDVDNKKIIDITKNGSLVLVFSNNNHMKHYYSNE